MRTALAITAFFAAAAPAAATTYDIVNVTATYPNLGNVDVPGYGAVWATPMHLFASTAPTVAIPVYCADLEHIIYIEGGQSLTYVTGLIKFDGAGHPLAETVSNEMGQLASIGLHTSNENLAIAAQAAIWDLEYHIPVTSTDHGIQADITALLGAVHNNGEGWAHGLLPESGTQTMVTGIPETGTWAMMLMGFGLLGFAGYRRRAAVAI